ncbi:MAG TPA: helix-turn-helix domain-containing protein [Candidatus Paceibacterota bacterium]
MSEIIDGIESKNLVKRLGDLGLSEKEARVYIALLPYSDIGSSKLIRATRLHGQFVYDALEKLEQLGLARHVIQNGRKKFSANAPSRLLSLIEEKRLAAQSIAKELQARFIGAHEQDFEIYQGDEAFIAHQIELLKGAQEGSTYYVLANQTERYMATFEAYGMDREYEKLRKERDISIKYLGAEAQRERLARLEKEWFKWSYRIFPGLGVGLISVEMLPETVSFIVYGETILDFTLRNKDVANGYREFFDAIWNLSKK